MAWNLEPPDPEDITELKTIESPVAIGGSGVKAAMFRRKEYQLGFDPPAAWMLVTVHEREMLELTRTLAAFAIVTSKEPGEEIKTSKSFGDFAWDLDKVTREAKRLGFKPATKDNRHGLESPQEKNGKSGKEFEKLFGPTKKKLSHKDNKNKLGIKKSK